MSNQRNHSQYDQSSMPSNQARPIPTMPLSQNLARNRAQHPDAASGTTPRYGIQQKAPTYATNMYATNMYAPTMYAPTAPTMYAPIPGYHPDLSQQSLPIREAGPSKAQKKAAQQAAHVAKQRAQAEAKARQKAANKAMEAKRQAVKKASIEQSQLAKAIKNAPKPDPAYLQQANNQPLASSAPKKLLVILDLNGTLVVRSKANRKTFTPRPYLATFLETLFKKHKVLVWSSAQPASVDAMVKGIMTQEQQKQLVAVWDRMSLHLSPAQYREKVQVHKRLTWLWEDERVQSHAEPKWDQTNTVLIDDSYLKASSEPFNHIEVPEYTAETMEQENNQPPILRELVNYLEEASYFEDVSAYIRTHKFKMPGAIQGAGAPSASVLSADAQEYPPMNLAQG